MRHLTLEELARLVDEAPEPREITHLATCSRCAAEVEALRLQTTALAGLPDPVPPENLGLRLEQALMAEGLIGHRPSYRRRAALLRAAAGLVLFIAGGAVGTYVVAPVMGAGAAPPAVTLELSDPSSDLDQAAVALAVAEAEYLGALSTFSELSGRGDGVDPLNRLAALEGIVVATGVALQEAPADPVINNYHLTALGQRDALLRGLDQVATVDRWF